MMKTTTNVTGTRKSEAQLKGIADAMKYADENDRDLDEFIAFMSFMDIPIGSEPLSYKHFDSFEQYLSAFYQTRLQTVRTNLERSVSYYRGLYLDLVDRCEKQKPKTTIRQTVRRKKAK